MPFSASTIATLSLICALSAALLALQWTSNSQCPSSTCTPPDAASTHAGYFEYECAGKPHQSSWSSWWHPQRTWTGTESSHHRGQGAGMVTKDWNILYHLGGNGPWVEKVVDVVEGGIAVPDGCEVEQVHMMARHAERYPTVSVAKRVTALVDRMRKSGIAFGGDLAFFNDWELFWSDDTQIEQLTSTGPFSGTLGAFTTGVRLRTRYSHLLSLARSLHPKTTFWASDSQRVIDTARYFGAGFFGLTYPNTTHLEIIPETASQGANTLTPGDTCLRYLSDAAEGHDKGYAMLHRFRSTYLPAVRARLKQQNAEMDFADDEVYAMQEMCGFETTVRGSSRWCDVFTRDEFRSFEYARDVLHYYRAGPGTRYAGVMGWLWLNATTELMLQGQRAGPLFFSLYAPFLRAPPTVEWKQRLMQICSVHDGDIAPMITALDIINDEVHLPVTHITAERKWRKSQVSPMGGRTIFELLSCGPEKQGSPEKYVRININDGITVVPGCDSGPGRSCPLEEFATRTKRKGEEVGDFREKCGLSEDAADRITFLHQ